MPSIEDFEERLEETQSGALEVSDFALKYVIVLFAFPDPSNRYCGRNADAFPSAEVLVPAPMAVSIFGGTPMPPLSRFYAHSLRRLPRSTYAHSSNH